MAGVERLAPTSDAVVEYDRYHLVLYAALLEASDAGRPWREVASEIMHIDVDVDDAKTCWRSHLDRARWLVGDGLGHAIAAFGRAD